MPPRRSVGRNATATPARSTRANSAIPVDGSGGQRTTRAATQAPTVRTSRDANLSQLRHVELQQSYAYGSEAAIKDLDRLDADRRQSKGKALAAIDAGLEQAADRFDDHLDKAQGNLENSPPASRTRRKTSREPSQQPSQRPERDSPDGVAKAAAWADSLESDQLEEIAEEEGEESEIPEDRSRKDTEPSSFPSGIFDQSYNFERGRRKPNAPLEQIKQGPSIFERFRVRSRGVATMVRDKLVDMFHTLLDLMQRTLRAISTAILEVPESPAFAIGVKTVFGALCLGAVSVMFCFFYSRFLCDPSSISIVSQNLQKLCGTCTAANFGLDLSESQQQDVTRVSATLQNIQKQIQLLESRMYQKFDSRQSSLESEIEKLKQQQIEMSSLLANLQVQEAPISGEGIASPLLPRVNFFAPSNGALVDPKRSTPTKAKQQPFVKRFLMRLLQIKQTTSKGPTTALEPWHDVGDCWCAASPDEGDFVRLHITTNEYIYPTEVVVEHFPLAGIRNPGTAPRMLELWADFSAMGTEEQSRLQILKMQENSVLDAGVARLVSMQYDSSPGVNHVQSFKLDVNQAVLSHYAKTFVLRVTSTYGADHACLYRVRLHGVPVDAQVGERLQDWYQQQGYVVEEQS